MQDAWVKRHRGTVKAGDRHLFGTVNFLLGLASFVVGLLVYLHRPIPMAWVAASAGIALALMTALIPACRLESRPATERTV